MKTSLVAGSDGQRHSFSRRGSGKSSTRFAARWGVRGFAFLALTSLLAIQQAGHLQAVATLPPNAPLPPNALPDPHSYVVTGNYAVGSIDVPSQLPQGAWTDRIHISTCPKTATPGNPAENCVPANADIVSAYLYFEMIDLNPAADNVKFQGKPIIQPNFSSVVKRSDQSLTGLSNCYASGQPLILTMFRADVRNLLPVQVDANYQPTGKRLVGDGDLTTNLDPAHPDGQTKYPAGLKLEAIEGGTGNLIPQVAGFSLVVVYRDPSQPLRKIVVYENPKNAAGSPGQVYIQPNLTSVTTQTFAGIYKSAADTSALVTLIGATAQKNTNDRIQFRGNPNATATLLATDPFKDGQTGSDRTWASVTYNVSTAGTNGMSLMTPGTYTTEGPFNGFGETPSLIFDHAPTNGSYDCPALGVAVLSTAVADADGDGLPDGAEDGNALYDADGTPLHLNAWGASSSHKDFFLEVDAMKADPETPYGSDAAPYSLLTSSVSVATATDHVGHNHMLQPAAVKILIDAYLGAPTYTTNPVFAPGPITPHIDVGPNLTESYISAINIMANDPNGPYYRANGPFEYRPFFIPATDARGGDLVPETPCGLGAAPCQFQNYPGTISFRNALLPYTYQHLDWDRVNFFHYLFSVHALANAKSPYPCVNNGTLQNYNGTPAPATPDLYDSGKSCTNGVDNNAFRVPRTVGGRSQLPGSKAVIALGGWQKVSADGTVVEQAAPELYGGTSLHELGHQVNLWHGGPPPTWDPTTRLRSVQPNCKPTYVSVMSYMFQVNGQRKDNDPRTYFDYSRDPDVPANVNTLIETQLTDIPFFPALSYRTAWYAPPTFEGASLAKRYCSGKPFADPNNPPSMARMDGPNTDQANNYNADSVLDQVAYSQDVNFDGPPPPTGSGATVLTGYNDWDHAALNQLGAGIDPRGFSNAASDNDASDNDASDNDASDNDASDNDASDNDSKDKDLDDVLVGDLGLFPAPTNPSACVIGTAGCLSASPSTTNYDRNYVTWTAPFGGNPVSYSVYRSTGGNFNPSPNGHVTVGTVSASLPNSLPPTSFIDPEELPDGVQFTYKVRANYVVPGCGAPNNPCPFSGLSDPATVTAKNLPPLAANDTYNTDKALTVSNPGTAPNLGILVSDTDPDTSPFVAGATLAAKLKAVLVVGPLHGTLTCGTAASPSLCADGSFTYTPFSGFQGLDTFTYKANDGNWPRDPNKPMNSIYSNEATVTINVKPKKK